MNEFMPREERLRARLRPCLLLVAVSFLILLFATKSSPLYAFNDWSDMNWFTTVARGIFEGKVPYRDLFEQKGPILYFVTGLFCLPFGTSGMGVFLLELLCLSAFAILSYRIAGRYLAPLYAFLTATVTAVLTATTWAFNQGGGSVEEFFLPFFAWGLLKFLEFTEDGRMLSALEMFLMGVLVGVILWSKFLVAVYFFILMLLWLFRMVFLLKKGRRAAIGIGFGALGILAVSLPILIGFGAVGALGDLFRVYFYNNIFLYSAVYENQALGGAITVPPALIRLAFFAANFVVIAVLVFGLVRYVKCHRKSTVSPYLLLTFVGLQTAELLLLGYYSYYFLVLCVFLPLCLVPLVRHMAAKLEGKKPGLRGGLAIFACLCLVFTVLAGNNTRELLDGDKYAQTAVARRIAEDGKEDPSLLCYMMVDRGFYRAVGITPSTYYFAQNCYSEESYPEMYREYDRYVREGVTDYVVAYAFDYEKTPALFDRYEKIGEYSYDFYDCNYSGYEVTYYLFRLK